MDNGWVCGNTLPFGRSRMVIKITREIVLSQYRTIENQLFSGDYNRKECKVFS